MLQVVYLPLLSKLAVVVYATTRAVISQRLRRASTAHFDVGLTLAEYNAGIDQTKFLLQKEIQKILNSWPSILDSPSFCFGVQASSH